MANKFSRGELVILKSGGPPMTVDHEPGQASYKTDLYHCRWFKGATEHSGQFGEHLLDKFIPPAPKK